MYRFGRSTEEICIQKIESGIRGLKNDTKKPEDANCGFFLAKLKPLNEGMYQDLLSKYVKVKEDYDKRNS